MKYIVLLRGINVGGKRIKMAHLREVLESMGFQDVKTYLQSGNVILTHDSTDKINIAGEIEKELSQKFGFSVNIIIRTKDELESIINNNPFIKVSDIELDKLHVTFLYDEPNKKTVSSLNINKEDNEKFGINGREIYLYLPNGYARTKLNNNIFEKKLNTIATTRNWKTTNKLLELS